MRRFIHFCLLYSFFTADFVAAAGPVLTGFGFNDFPENPDANQTFSYVHIPSDYGNPPVNCDVDSYGPWVLLATRVYPMDMPDPGPIYYIDYQFEIRFDPDTYRADRLNIVTLDCQITDEYCELNHSAAVDLVTDTSQFSTFYDPRTHEFSLVAHHFKPIYIAPGISLTPIGQSRLDLSYLPESCRSIVSHTD